MIENVVLLIGRDELLKSVFDLLDEITFAFESGFSKSVVQIVFIHEDWTLLVLLFRFL